jgi:enamine deaminase RidA (YjgF/YER057c/UK114 family)
LTEIRGGLKVADESPKKEIIRPAEGIHPLPWPYSHGIKIGNGLLIAGQVALDEELRIVGPGDAEAQARQTWKNIQTVGEAAGGKVTDVVRVTTYVADLDDVEAIHHVRREVFPDGDYPTATVIQAAKLGLPGLLLETEAYAIIGCS